MEFEKLDLKKMESRRDEISIVKKNAEHVFDLIENVPPPDFFQPSKPLTNDCKDYGDKESWYYLGDWEEDPLKKVQYFSKSIYLREEKGKGQGDWKKSLEERAK